MKHSIDTKLGQALRGALATMALASTLAASAWAGEPGTPEQEARYRKLDRLQALGVGMLNQQTPKPPEPAEAASAPDQPRRLTGADFQQLAIAQNKKSAAALTETLDKIKADCGGQLLEWPEVGMSDDIFRRCTMHAHFGNISQIVAIDDGPTPLRLYVFANERAHKVYAIGGVITAIRP